MWGKREKGRGKRNASLFLDHTTFRPYDFDASPRQNNFGAPAPSDFPASPFTTFFIGNHCSSTSFPTTFAILVSFRMDTRLKPRVWQRNVSFPTLVIGKLPCHSRMFLAGIYLRVFQMVTCHRHAGMKKEDGSSLLAGGDGARSIFGLNHKDRKRLPTPLFRQKRGVGLLTLGKSDANTFRDIHIHKRRK